MSVCPGGQMVRKAVEESLGRTGKNMLLIVRFPCVGCVAGFTQTGLKRDREHFKDANIA